jgi:hypothetical protein
LFFHCETLNTINFQIETFLIFRKDYHFVPFQMVAFAADIVKNPAEKPAAVHATVPGAM